MPLIFALLLAISLSLSGCSLFRVLVSPGISPVEQKSQLYSVIDLSDRPRWQRLDPKKIAGDSPTPDAATTEASDITYQSRQDASVITLNSTCRENEAKTSPEEVETDLRELTRLLTLGFTNVSERQQTKLSIQGVTALQTTIIGDLVERNPKGVVESVPTVLRCVVLRNEKCTYDLIYISRPQFFRENEADFSRFVYSLRFRR